MELSNITLAKYKCFDLEESFDFTKLTVFTGANSSGKTSVITSLLSTIQSSNFPYEYSLNGDIINLGDFIEISNNKVPSNNIKLSFTYKNSYLMKGEFKITTEWQIDKLSKQPKLCNLELNSKEYQIYIKHNKRLNKYFISINSVLFKYLKSDAAKNEPLGSLISSVEGLIQSYQTASNQTKLNYKVTSLDENKLTIEVKTLDELQKVFYENKNTLQFKLAYDNIKSVIKNFSSNANYISSFRSFPNRTYLETTQNSKKITKTGDGYLDQILIWQSNNSSKYKELIYELKKMKIINNLKAYRLKGGRYEIKVKINPSEKFSLLQDVGFGISQFVPIIVADLQLNKNSTLIILQPEIHLHPSAQSSFGDYITNQIKNKQKNYIIETHSEYFLNKLRLNIVKGILNPEDVTIYYLETVRNRHIKHKIFFSKKGEIINAPKSFFDTYLMDLRDISISLLK